MPDWLAAWNRRATGIAGDLAIGLRGVPAIVQAAVLAALAAGIGWAVYRGWRADKGGGERPLADPAQRETSGPLNR